MWTTEILADFITEVRPDAITPKAREMVRRCVLDLMGAAAAGADSLSARAFRSVSARLFDKGVSTIWFSGLKQHEAAAALVNSAAASALDLDDGHRLAGGHPGASIIPAAMAVAESVGTNGEDLMTAIALGYEVGIRISAARDMSSLDTFSTGRWCSYGAAAAGGFLRKLPPGRLAEALAIAGVQSPGLSASGYSSVMGNTVKEGIPWSTFCGLIALDLAEQGFTGPTDILDHPSYYDRERILHGLGNGFAIEKVYFKPYSCCRWIHSALDALMGLMAENQIHHHEIDQVLVHTFGRALRLNNYANPDCLEGAQYSIPFSLAVAALQGEEALLPMSPRHLGQPDIVAFAEKVQIDVDPELDRKFPARAPARVVLRTSRGVFERLVQDALGDPSNPMDPSKLESKFRRLADRFLSRREQDQIIMTVANLENQSLHGLLDILAKTRLGEE